MNDSLVHYGVKGQKWGIRRTPEQLGHRTIGSMKRHGEKTHEDYAATHNNDKLSTISDAELRRRLNRLNMEKQYTDMMNTPSKKGVKIAKNTLKVLASITVASTTAITAYKNYNTIKEIVETIANSKKE